MKEFDESGELDIGLDSTDYNEGCDDNYSSNINSSIDEDISKLSGSINNGNNDPTSSTSSTRHNPFARKASSGGKSVFIQMKEMKKEEDKKQARPRKQRKLFL